MKREQNSSENLIREECGFPFVMSMPNSMSLAWGYEEYRDPIAEQGGVNLYAFERNSATNLFDELGFKLKKI